LFINNGFFVKNGKTLKTIETQSNNEVYKLNYKIIYILSAIVLIILFSRASKVALLLISGRSLAAIRLSFAEEVLDAISITDSAHMPEASAKSSILYRKMFEQELKEYKGARQGRNRFNSNRTVYCSFCKKEQAQVHKIIACPSGLFICDRCAELCLEVIEEGRNEASSVKDYPTKKSDRIISCLSCSKNENEEMRFAWGRNDDILLCNECVDALEDLLNDLE